MAARSSASPKWKRLCSTRPARSRSVRRELVGGEAIDPDILALTAAIAAHSRHPYSLALSAAGQARRRTPIVPDRVSEHPGSGLEASARRGRVSARPTRMGACSGNAWQSGAETASVVLSKDGQCSCSVPLRGQAALRHSRGDRGSLSTGARRGSPVRRSRSNQCGNLLRPLVFPTARGCLRVARRPILLRLRGRDERS